MKKSVIALAATLMVLMIPALGLAQTPYFQDFESLDMVDGTLAADGWLVYGNIFAPDGTYLWGHGPWAAPNNIGNWQDITENEGGPEQGMRQLVQYSDYGNADHGVGNLIESNLFQEQILPAGCSGNWTFSFDAKHGNLAGASTAFAFIKILNPADWSTTMYPLDMTDISSTWNSYGITVDVTGLDGMYLQFGWATVATNYEPCGVFYDNVRLATGTVATESATLDAVKSLYR